MDWEMQMETDRRIEAVSGEMLDGIPEFLSFKDSREFAPSMEVQAAEIRDVFFDFPELQYDVWKSLEIDERADILNALEIKIAEIEMRDPISVRHEATRPGLMGYFSENKLVISDNLLNQDSYEAYKESLNTLFHEGRHAYQDYNLKVARTEASDELVNAWKANYEQIGYASANPENQGYWRYYTQPVEVDARLFAETVIKKLDL